MRIVAASDRGNDIGPGGGDEGAKVVVSDVFFCNGGLEHLVVAQVRNAGVKMPLRMSRAANGGGR